MSKPRYIAHTSGKQPVGDDECIDVVLNGGYIIYSTYATRLRWTKLGNDCDIIAYRVSS